MQSPRTIPIFACCAMQASYAMIMISYKTKAMGFSASATVQDESALKLLAQLNEGLGMISEALRNFAMAFEAIGGMRGASSLSLLKLDELNS
jgi:hypothetical protein